MFYTDLFDLANIYTTYDEYVRLTLFKCIYRRVSEVFYKNEKINMWEFRGGKNDYFLIRVSSVFDRLKLVIVTENSMKNGKYILFHGMTPAPSCKPTEESVVGFVFLISL